MTETFSTVGVHVIAYMYATKYPLCIENIEDAARSASMTVLGKITSDTSVALILSESHLTVHRTSFGYRIDIYTCGGNAQPLVALNRLYAACEPERMVVDVGRRGDDVVSTLNG